MVYQEDSGSDVLLDAQDSWSNGDEWEEASTKFTCILCPMEMETVQACFSHCTAVHSFDFSHIRKKLGENGLTEDLDFLGCMKLVNFCRSSDKKTVNSDYVISSYEEWAGNDYYLKPQLEDDPMLYAFEDDQFENESVTEALNTNNLDELRRELKQSNARCAQLQSQLDAYKTMVEETYMPQSVKALVLSKDEDLMLKVGDADSGNYYFNSYAATEIHESMLRDVVRTEGYRDFIYNNKGYFKGKTVLDVGCGTGILSMFAAKAGAAKVFSVDNSEIIEKAKLIVKENNLDDIISFYRGKVETIELPVEKVDIIISEWMGYFLLYEGMLDSVLVARDRWLKDDGLMAPSCTKILLSAIGDADWYNDKVNFWKNVYGFSMTSMNQDYIKNGLITVVPCDSMITNSVVVNEIQIRTVNIPELDFDAEFCLEVISDGKIYALCGWFDTFFQGHSIDSVMFSTSPFCTPTHWMQTAFILEHPIAIEKGDKVFGSFTCKKSASNPRELVVVIEWNVKDKNLRGIQEFGVV